VLGHSGGDDAIRLYCNVVRGVLGIVGEVYRRGGDEVVVLAPGLCDVRARELAERTREEVEARFRAWGAEHGLHPVPTASIGLVRCTTESSEIIRLADDAQRQAKQQGKNRVVCLAHGPATVV